MREAIINAFCHRDYRDPDFVHVAVFRDRVEIRNPGGLFGGLTIEDILKGNISKRRNPLVAELLRRIHMVEAWGRGMPLILKNAPDVKFREVAQIFIASFDRPSFKEPDDQASPETKGKTKGKAKGKAEALLNFLTTHPSATIPEMAVELNLTENGVNYHLRKLKETNRLKRVGGRKKGRWQVDE
jgi:ATP-dependent DNA helicase RecG